MEEWRDVRGFENYFKVSNNGNVFSKRTNKILAQTTLKNGYLVVNTRIGGRKGVAYSLRVHRLVADAFLPEPSEELVQKCSKEHFGKVIVRHKDSDKKNNCVENLEWGDSQSNSNDYVCTQVFRDAIKKVSGTNNVAHKLSKDDILLIVDLHSRGYTQRQIAGKFDVFHSVVGNVLRGVTYVQEIEELGILPPLRK